MALAQPQEKILCACGQPHAFISVDHANDGIVLSANKASSSVLGYLEAVDESLADLFVAMPQPPGPTMKNNGCPDRCRPTQRISQPLKDVRGHNSRLR